MSGIDEIIGYQKNPDDDLYGMLNCSEHSTVSVSCGNVGGRQWMDINYFYRKTGTRTSVKVGTEII